MIARFVESLKRLAGWTAPRPRNAPAEPPAAAPPHDDAPAIEITETAIAASPEVVPESQVRSSQPDVAVARESEAVDDPASLVEEAIPAPEPREDPQLQPEAPATRADAGVVLRLDSARAEPVSFEVTRTGATVGRAPENGIRLDDLSVSRKHARIAYRQGAYWLSDVGSVGGTWVDGAKLSAPRRLAAGQVIDIGVCRLTVVSLAGTPSAPARKRS